MHAPQEIDFAIGIPAYGRTGYLKIAVESAVQQSHPAKEIIIGQNTHPDPEVDRQVSSTITELVDQYPTVSAFRNTTDCNLSANLNAISKRVSVRYVAFIGDDDRLKPSFLEKVLEKMDAPYDVVFANHHIIDAEGAISDKYSGYSSGRYGRKNLSEGPLDKLTASRAVWQCAVPLFASVIRNDLLKAMPFANDLLGLDTDFFIRLAGAGGRFFFIPENLTEIRYHAGNITKPASQYEKLVDHLGDIEYDAEVEDARNRLLTMYGYTTVSKYMLEGKPEKARAFFKRQPARSPSVIRMKLAFQRFCLALPDGLALQCYSKANRLLRKLRPGSSLSGIR